LKEKNLRLNAQGDHDAARRLGKIDQQKGDLRSYREKKKPKREGKLSCLGKCRGAVPTLYKNGTSESRVDVETGGRLVPFINTGIVPNTKGKKRSSAQGRQKGELNLLEEKASTKRNAQRKRRLAMA